MVFFLLYICLSFVKLYKEANPSRPAAPLRGRQPGSQTPPESVGGAAGGGVGHSGPDEDGRHRHAQRLLKALPQPPHSRLLPAAAATPLRTLTLFGRLLPRRQPTGGGPAWGRKDAQGHLV